jgi:hypothetical protein
MQVNNGPKGPYQVVDQVELIFIVGMMRADGRNEPCETTCLANTYAILVKSKERICYGYGGKTNDYSHQ